MRFSYNVAPTKQLSVEELNKMNASKKEKHKIPPANILLPFFRASTAIRIPDRTLLVKDLPPDSFFAQLAKTDVIFRHNTLRILAASLLATKTDAALLFVEGWPSNIVERSTHTKKVTGAYCGTLILKMLQRQSVTPFRGNIYRKNCSRCTWEEIDAAHAQRLEIAPQAKLIGVTHTPCPSAERAARYMKLKAIPNAEVQTPETILASLQLNEMQRACVQALQPSQAEQQSAFRQEAPNWLLHWLSRGSRFAFPTERPLEAWLAGKLRQGDS